MSCKRLQTGVKLNIENLRSLLSSQYAGANGKCVSIALSFFDFQ